MDRVKGKSQEAGSARDRKPEQLLESVRKKHGRSCGVQLECKRAAALTRCCVFAPHPVQSSELWQRESGRFGLGKCAPLVPLGRGVTWIISDLVAF